MEQRLELRLRNEVGTVFNIANRPLNYDQALDKTLPCRFTTTRAKEKQRNLFFSYVGKALFFEGISHV